MEVGIGREIGFDTPSQESDKTIDRGNEGREI